MSPMPTYARETTALLLVDPYNDFLAEEGKVWPRVQPVAEEVNLIANLKTIDAAVRGAGLQVAIAPHRRWEPGDYEDWEYPNPSQIGIMTRHSFARANGAAIGIPIWRPGQVTSSPRSIGGRAALPTPISTSNCDSAASRT